MKKFYEKIRELREEQGITREDFCGDESELSVRQLARIEKGDSIPSLSKAYYIAEVLGVSLDSLVSRESLELPKRYRELKYKILRVPIYRDDSKTLEREKDFTDIFGNYYDNLPEDEQVIIDGLQSKFEVYQTGDVNFGIDILTEYFEQVKVKKKYTINDLIIIDLYILISTISDYSSDIFDISIFETICDQLLLQQKFLDAEQLYILNLLILNSVSVLIDHGRYPQVQKLLEESYRLMSKTQDFQKMPLYFMYDWKNQLFYFQDYEKGKVAYEQSLLCARMTNDEHLVKMIIESWEKDQARSH